MPYYRRKTTGKSYRSRKPRQNYVKKVVKDVMSRNVETKRSYFTGSVTLNSTTPTAALDLSQITQGVDGGQRIGYQVKVKSIKFRYTLISAAVFGACRMSAVRTKSNAFAGSSMPTAIEGLFDRERITVLKDTVITVNTSQLWHSRQMFLKGNTITWDTSAINSATKGSTFIGFMGTGTAGWGHTIGYTAEVTYTDA